MNDNTKIKIKENLKKSIRQFFRNKQVDTYQILDNIFPVERRIRSLIGGLETSLGTTFWEPVARALAENNGFKIISHKLQMPEPFPDILRLELDRLNDEREKKANGKVISTKKCIERLRNAAMKVKDGEIKEYKNPPSGAGVDIYLFKNDIEYMFDIKTTTPNQGAINNFSRQLLTWYAYRLARDPQVEVETRIVIPFNPNQKSWYEHNHSKLSNSPLDISNDIWVENEFWNFCSGEQDTFTHLESLFIELGKEGFSKEFDDIFYPNKKQ